MINSVILLLIASFCDATVEVLSHNFYNSVYGKLFSRNIIEEMWWNGQFSWKNLYNGMYPSFGRNKIKVLGVKIPKPAFMCHATGAFTLIKRIMIVGAVATYHWSPMGVYADAMVLMSGYFIMIEAFKKFITVK